MANITFIENDGKKYVSLDDLLAFLDNLKTTAYWKTGEQILNDAVNQLIPVSHK
jgi:hypothetical protein